jgi:hypothetical protein
VSVGDISALAGSAIGGLATFATTWLTHHAQTNAQRLAQAMARQEHLYGEFVDEAARSLTDALTHELDDPAKLVRLYALVGKLRLFASTNVVSQAEEVMHRIVEIYNSPIGTFTIRKTVGRAPICFGPSAKHAVKTYGFRVFPRPQCEMSADIHS